MQSLGGRPFSFLNKGSQLADANFLGMESQLPIGPILMFIAISEVIFLLPFVLSKTSGASRQVIALFMLAQSAAIFAFGIAVWKGWIFK